MNNVFLQHLEKCISIRLIVSYNRIHIFVSPSCVMVVPQNIFFRIMIGNAWKVGRRLSTKKICQHFWVCKVRWPLCYKLSIKSRSACDSIEKNLSLHFKNEIIDFAHMFSNCRKKNHFLKWKSRLVQEIGCCLFLSFAGLIFLADFSKAISYKIFQYLLIGKGWIALSHFTQQKMSKNFKFCLDFCKNQVA